MVKIYVMKFGFGIIWTCLSLMVMGQTEQINLKRFDNGKPELIGRYDESGKKERVWLEFWENGNLKYQTSYSDGIPNGDYKTFRENGNFYGYGNHKEGVIDGLFVAYDMNGELRAVMNWEMGALVEQEIYNLEAKETGTIEIIGGKKFVW